MRERGPEKARDVTSLMLLFASMLPAWFVWLALRSGEVTLPGPMPLSFKRNEAPLAYWTQVSLTALIAVVGIGLAVAIAGK